VFAAGVMLESAESISSLTMDGDIAVPTWSNMSMLRLVSSDDEKKIVILTSISA
jgi:hypothetical protein